MATSDKLVLFDIDDVLFNTEVFIASDLRTFSVFKEVPDVLDNVSKIADVGVLSQGDEELQIKKLMETDIYTFFKKEHIHIVKSKDDSLKELLKEYTSHKSICFIDDRVQGLYYAKKAVPDMITIWFRRGRYKDSQVQIEGFTPDHTINDLNELLPVIKLQIVR